MIESSPPPPATLPPPVAPPEMRFPQQFTYQEVANLKRVTKQTVMEWVKKGMIPSPIYTGYTARFTEDQVADIMMGTRPAGFYPVTSSPRSEVGKLGGSSTMKGKGKARNPAQVRADADRKKLRDITRAKKPAAKKPAAKKPTKTKTKTSK